MAFRLSEKGLNFYMKEILELIIKNLVANKEDVSISENIEKNNVEFTVKINPKEKGRVIGREGRIANSIRIVMKSLGNAEKKKVSVHFVD